MPDTTSSWHFHVWRGETRWVGMAKRTPFVTGHPITEPGDLWFEFGATEAEAMAAVKRSVLQ